MLFSQYLFQKKKRGYNAADVAKAAGNTEVARFLKQANFIEVFWDVFSSSDCGSGDTYFEWLPLEMASSLDSLIFSVPPFPSCPEGEKRGNSNGNGGNGNGNGNGGNGNGGNGNGGNGNGGSGNGNGGGGGGGGNGSGKREGGSNSGSGSGGDGDDGESGNLRRRRGFYFIFISVFFF